MDINKAIIKTERLVIKPLTLNDLEAYNSYASDKEITKYMMFLPMDGIEMSKEFLTAVEKEWAKETPRAYEFGIFLNDTNIGEISVYNEDGLAELGWILDPKYQGHGYAFEAAHALMEFTVKHLNMNHFIAHCDTDNAPSWHLLEKLALKRTKETYGRKNKSSNEIKSEYTYETIILKD